MHPSILALEIPWTEDAGGLQSMWLQKSWSNEYEMLSYCDFNLY